jgi:hypothetical protein
MTQNITPTLIPATRMNGETQSSSLVQNRKVEVFIEDVSEEIPLIVYEYESLTGSAFARASYLLDENAASLGSITFHPDQHNMIFEGTGAEAIIESTLLMSTTPDMVFTASAGIAAEDSRDIHATNNLQVQMLVYQESATQPGEFDDLVLQPAPIPFYSHQYIDHGPTSGFPQNWNEVVKQNNYADKHSLITEAGKLYQVKLVVVSQTSMSWVKIPGESFRSTMNDEERGGFKRVTFKITIDPLRNV